MSGGTPGSGGAGLGGIAAPQELPHHEGADARQRRGALLVSTLLRRTDEEVYGRRRQSLVPNGEAQPVHFRAEFGPPARASSPLHALGRLARA